MATTPKRLSMLWWRSLPRVFRKANKTSPNTIELQRSTESAKRASCKRVAVHSASVEVAKSPISQKLEECGQSDPKGDCHEHVNTPLLKACDFSLRLHRANKRR